MAAVASRVAEVVAFCPAAGEPSSRIAKIQYPQLK
jgi:hypothetical protein